MKYENVNFKRRRHPKKYREYYFSEEEQQLLKNISDEIKWMVGEKTPLYVESRRASIDEVASTLVKYKGGYMADFEKDETGNLLCVRYNRVRE